MLRKSGKKFKEQQNGASGSVPEYGAIFMACSSTKKECLRRRLFGLPAWQAEFVKHVKAGMVLFLFEYESRELHGVFLACSDGGMNIVPHAYSSSGMQFPAQVEFTRRWLCRPLCEDEFRDAIIDNYFSAKKFNFGLSEVQVQRLLTLFSLKKVEKPPLQGPSTRRKVAKPIGMLANDLGRAADDNRFQTSSILEHNGTAGGELDSRMAPSEYCFANNRASVNDGRSMAIPGIEDEPELGQMSDMATRNEYFKHNSSDFGRVVDSSRIGNEFCMDTNFRTDASMSSDYFLKNSRRVPENLSSAPCDRIENEYREKDDLAQVASTEYHGSWSNLNLSVDHSKQAVEADPTRQPIKFPYPIDPENSNLPYPRYQGDTTITSAASSDPDVPQVDFNCSSSFGVNHNSTSAREHGSSLGGYVMNAFPSKPGQPFPQPMEPRGASNLMGSKYELGDYIPLASKHCEYSTRTNMLPVACPESLIAARPFEIEGHREPPLQTWFPDAPASKEIGNQARSYKIRSYSYSPSKYSSFADSLASQNRIEHKMPEYDNDKGLANNSSDFTGGQLRICDIFAEHESRKIRRSVFARLALPPKESDAEEDSPSVDSSVDEVMAILHQRHDEWMKKKNSRPITEDSDGVGKPKMKKQKDSTSELLEDDMMAASKETIVNDAPALPFIDFKRRRETRKSCDDGQTHGSRDNAENLVSPGSRHKRRKLIRPKFSNDEPSKDKVGISETPFLGTVLESKADDNKVSVTTSVVDRTKSCPEVDSSQVMVQTGNRDGNEDNHKRT